MSPEQQQPELTTRWWFWPAAISLVYFSLHMATASRYGYFRDALYYLDCGEHLDWGYVDQPPLIALIAWLTRHTLGTSLPALIFWPALAGCGRVLITAACARELGAKRFGIALTALLAATPGVWYAIDHQFAMNALEPMFWTGCAFALLRMINTGNPRWWLVFGAVAGLGLENKYSVAAFALALLAGLLLTPQRKFLFTPWLLAGGGVAALIFLPNFLWNVRHHWPFFELMHNIRATGRDLVLPLDAFVWQQVLLMNPLSLPFWLGGLAFYLFSQEAKSYRALGWAFVITVTFFFLAHGKNYYSVPAYPVVLAAGGAFAERLLARFDHRPRLTAALRAAAFLWLIAAIVPLLPLTLPLLPVDAYLRYQQHLPFKVPRSEKAHLGTPLPQHFADEFGWPEIVAQVARVYYSLPEAERAKTAILADNYGEAGAIDFFGAQYGLPKAICTHQNYFLWGPRDYTGEIVILVGSARIENAKPFFRSVEWAADVNNPFAITSENRPILLARGLKANLQVLWPKLKNWN
jgi:hypothetical protein